MLRAYALLLFVTCRNVVGLCFLCDYRTIRQQTQTCQVYFVVRSHKYVANLVVSNSVRYVMCTSAYAPRSRPCLDFAKIEYAFSSLSIFVARNNGCNVVGTPYDRYVLAATQTDSTPVSSTCHLTPWQGARQRWGWKI